MKAPLQHDQARLALDHADNRPQQGQNQKQLEAAPNYAEIERNP